MSRRYASWSCGYQAQVPSGWSLGPEGGPPAFGLGLCLRHEPQALRHSATPPLAALTYTYIRYPDLILSPNLILVSTTPGEPKSLWPLNDILKDREYEIQAHDSSSVRTSL